ncbi:sodium channel protein Nach-like [Solenopsis invicta]|uniref:sodium channel protein Nach-like n=1 Tax=Solenopsis invicta TaxID=13686 RepID=UPI00193C9271|nr:sodium channel protein Nach-like [Solenopsis invicta]
MTSGGVTEVMAKPLFETYLNVLTTLFLSNSNVKRLSRKDRNCIFDNEENPTYGNVDAPYTYSDCIVECKLHNIQKLCGCRPFFYPRRNKEESKWMTIFPSDKKNKHFQNKKDALYCHKCYPDCEDLMYDVFSWTSSMTPGQYNTELIQGNVTNYGIVHVYLSESDTLVLKQDVSVYWYEVLSDIGGFCGVFIGFSFISVVEFLYFSMLAVRDLFLKKSALQKNNNCIVFDKMPFRNETLWAIYWNELIPRPWNSEKPQLTQLDICRQIHRTISKDPRSK